MTILKVIKASVQINGHGTDKIYLTLDHRTPFPQMGYEANATIEAQAGEGINWVRKELGIEPEIIDMKGH